MKKYLLRKLEKLNSILVNAYEGVSTHNLQHELTRIAIKETAKFVNESLVGAMFFGDRGSVHEYALQLCTVEGLHLEFGVYQGKSITYLASNKPAQEFFGFDSFIGLKEDWVGTYMKKGHFDVGGELPAVPENVTLIKGYFQDTLGEFLKVNPQEVSFVNFDADTYESTLYILEEIRERLQPGSILVFDEFMGFHGYKQGEYLAWKEFSLKHDIKYKYAAHSFEQVAIRLI